MPAAALAAEIDATLQAAREQLHAARQALQQVVEANAAVVGGLTELLVPASDGTADDRSCDDNTPDAA